MLLLFVPGTAIPAPRAALQLYPDLNVHNAPDIHAAFTPVSRKCCTPSDTSQYEHRQWISTLYTLDVYTVCTVVKRTELHHHHNYLNKDFVNLQCADVTSAKYILQ